MSKIQHLDPDPALVADVQEVDLLISDLNGLLRGKRVSRDSLDKAYRDGVCLPRSLFALDILGNTVESTGLGFDTGDGDRICFPVESHCRPVPWSDGRAQLLMSMYEYDGSPLFCDPRHVLKKQLDAFQATGLRPVVAVELEFYLIDAKRDARGHIQKPINPDTGERESDTQVYSIDNLSGYDTFLKTLVEACRAQNLPATTAVAEYAPGQFEINLKHRDDPLAACDDAVLLKRLIRSVAQQCGFKATFMAKPYAEDAGNGMHIHISMLDANGQNAFAAGDNSAVYQGNPAAQRPLLSQAIAGLLDTMQEGIAFYAPNVNSYRRLQPEMYVPMSAHWAFDNRTSALRIPAGDAKNLRIEHRVAGADANPYLVLASLIAGIRHGIDNHLEAPPPETGNVYEQHPASFPSHLRDSIAQLRNSQTLAPMLGREFCEHFCLTREYELSAFERTISPLEYDWYLNI